MIRAPFLKEIYLHDFNFDSNTFPFSIPFIKNNNFHLKIHSPVIIISGDNGSGKSTILKSIAFNCNFNLNGGSNQHNFDSNESASLLNKHLKFLWNIKVSNGFYLRSDNFINFANFIDEQAKEHGEVIAYKYYGGKSLNQQSHGEALLSLFFNRFNEEGIYILDEPEVALSPEKILALMRIIKKLTDNGKSQFIIATHSSMLMAYPYAQFFYIKNNHIEETSYDETEHYTLTKSFLDCPERYFKHLFDD